MACVDFASVNGLCPATYTPRCCSDTVTVVDYTPQMAVILPIPTPANANQTIIVDPTGRYRLADNPATNTTGPANEGYQAWNYDPILAGDAVPLPLGTLLLFRIDASAYPTIDSMAMAFVSLPTLTAGQNFVGLYNAAGALLLASGDITSQLSVGRVLLPYIGTYTAAQEPLYAALLLNGTGTAVAAGTLVVPSLLTSPPLTLPRFASIPGPFTSLPGSIAIPGANAGLPAWVALA